MKKPEEFYRFYRDKMLCLDAKPNAAHLKLAELEAAGKLTGEGLNGYPNHTDFDPGDPRIQEIDGCYLAVLKENDHAF